MKKCIALGLALSFVAIANAQWGKRIRGNGNVVTVERSVGSYDFVGFAGLFVLVLIIGEEGLIIFNLSAEKLLISV